MLQTIDQIHNKRKHRSCASTVTNFWGTNDQKCNIYQKTIQSLASFYKLNEKDVPVLSAIHFIEISETQPNSYLR